MGIIQAPQTRVPPLLRARLAGIGVTSPAPQALAEFYASALDHQGAWKDDAWVGARADRWTEIRPGAANALAYIAYQIQHAHLDALRKRLRAANIAFTETTPETRLSPGIRFLDPGGNTLLFGTPADRPELGAKADALDARLQHVVLASIAVAPMLAFYSDIIGFSPSDYVLDADEDLTSVFLRCSEEHHSLAIFRAGANRLDHACYDVGDWSKTRDWADRFAELGVPIKWGPGRHGPGNNLFMFVNDPDGNWIEFSAELEHIEGERHAKRWAHEERTLNKWGHALMRS
jgi:catechol 2,3-dioxygenase